jgi:hypothetical protein
MPTLGFPCITPEGNPSPTVNFVVQDPVKTRAKCALRLRYYNNAAGIDRLLNALGW